LLIGIIFYGLVQCSSQKLLNSKKMSLTARLHITGHSNESTGSAVISCDYSFSQEIDDSGRVMSRVKGGLINLTLRGVDDPEIIQWMLTSNATKSGRISFSGVTATGPTRRIEFVDAYLVYYRETFNNQSDIVLHLSISARQISISGVDHANEWIRNNPQHDD
jgi:hypothetical protein